MKFARIGSAGREQPVVLHGGAYYALDATIHDIDAEFWKEHGPSVVAQRLAAGELLEVDVDGHRLGSPIVRPSSVYCIGMNYRAHAEESGSSPPDVPIVFHKAPNTVSGPNDDVMIPHGSVRTDWEVELGVVISSPTCYLESPSDASDHIGGFVTVNDLSERDFQFVRSGGQWSKGKSCPGFCPTGPLLVTPDEVDVRALRLFSWVNGELRQDSSTADMIFDVLTIVYDLSQFVVLEPGDLVCTGTPEGVALSGRFPYLRNGDIVEVEVEGLGRQKQRFVSS